jgi:hypothetical protein
MTTVPRNIRMAQAAYQLTSLATLLNVTIR